ncbi:MAG: hypothetical protein ABFD29_01280, partial [Anaerolineaceae bacterium]
LQTQCAPNPALEYISKPFNGSGFAVGGIESCLILPYTYTGDLLTLVREMMVKEGNINGTGK